MTGTLITHNRKVSKLCYRHVVKTTVALTASIVAAPTEDEKMKEILKFRASIKAAATAAAATAAATAAAATVGAATTAKHVTIDTDDELVDDDGTAAEDEGVASSAGLWGAHK